MPWPEQKREETEALAGRARSLRGQGFRVRSIAEMLGISKDYAGDLLRSIPQLAPERPIELALDGRLEFCEEERTCTRSGCKTQLSGYNDGDRCWVHSGWDEAAWLESNELADFEKLYYWIANEWLVAQNDVAVMS